MNLQNDFAKALNQVINSNNSDNPTANYRPVTINQKTPFLGRILPIDDHSFPFVLYQQVWVSYTNKAGQVNSTAINVNTDDPNDKLGKLLQEIVSFNHQYNQEHPDHASEGDIIKVAAGKFPLRIAQRAAFLGVALQKNQQGQWSQSVNPQGQLDIKSYDISNGALVAIAEKLKPEFPYMYNGQQMFQDGFQFITANATFPVSVKFNKPASGKGIGNWSAEVIQGMALPAVNFNYLEKDETGNLKYVDDLVKMNQATYLLNPNFADFLYDQLSATFNAQKQQVSSNPYVAGAPADTSLPFGNGQQDVVKSMTGQPATNFTSAPQAPITGTPNQASVAPQNQTTTAPQAPIMGVPSQAPVNAQPQIPTAPQAPVTQPTQAPVTPQSNVAPVQPKAPSQAPVAPQGQPVASAQQQAPTSQPAIDPNVQASLDTIPETQPDNNGTTPNIDDLLSGSASLEDLLK